MHIEGPRRILTCDHGTHTDEQFTQCLAQQWGVSVPKLIAMMAALVLSHTERAATRPDGGMEPLLPELPGRACHWCHRPLPAPTHHARRYCEDRDCRRLAFNAWQRAGRPVRPARR